MLPRTAIYLGESSIQNRHSSSFGNTAHLCVCFCKHFYVQGTNERSRFALRNRECHKKTWNSRLPEDMLHAAAPVRPVPFWVLPRAPCIASSTFHRDRPEIRAAQGLGLAAEGCEGALRIVVFINLLAPRSLRPCIESLALRMLDNSSPATLALVHGTQYLISGEAAGE